MANMRVYLRGQEPRGRLRATVPRHEIDEELNRSFVYQYLIRKLLSSGYRKLNERERGEGGEVRSLRHSHRRISDSIKSNRCSGRALDNIRESFESVEGFNRELREISMFFLEPSILSVGVSDDWVIAFRCSLSPRASIVSRPINQILTRKALDTVDALSDNLASIESFIRGLRDYRELSMLSIIVNTLLRTLDTVNTPAQLFNAIDGLSGRCKSMVLSVRVSIRP